MQFRWVVMLSAVAVALALAACAETGGMLAASAAEEAAVIAATQATIATTQAIKNLETASTQMSGQGQVQAGHGIPIPQLPSVNKGTIIVFTPNYMIIQKDGKRLIMPRENYNEEDGAGQ